MEPESKKAEIILTLSLIARELEEILQFVTEPIKPDQAFPASSPVTQPATGVRPVQP
jgi:hypothetical protein